MLNAFLTRGRRLVLPTMVVFALVSASATAANPAAAVKACSATNLRLSVDGRDGQFNGMSHGGTALSIRNVGPDCTLPSAPALHFYGASGKRLMVRLDRTAAARTAPVVVGAGHRADMELRWVSGPVYQHSRKMRAVGVGVMAGRVVLRAPLEAVMYGALGGSVLVQQSPLRAIEGMASER